jgi:TATA-box binding protein (TBP) (component of TFIID and TFIIIB)
MDEQFCFKPTPYKISTITATGGINTNIDLDSFYKNVDIVPYDGDVSGFVYIEYGKKKSETFSRGYHKKLSISRRKKVVSKRFDNQTTIILKHFGMGMGKDNNLTYFVNIKVFKNGNVQMTGLKSLQQGTEAINYLIREVQNIHNTKDANIVEDFGSIKNINNRVRLINSDFRIGFDIKRDKLCKILQNKYNVFCSYEPCIYPGAKVQFFWNSMRPTQTGICNCGELGFDCNGKGSGDGPGCCKKITVAVFQSGCIIITGAQAEIQIDDTYKFICDLIVENYDDIHKKPFAAEEMMPKEKKKVVKRAVKQPLDAKASK